MNATIRQVHKPKIILWPDGQKSSRVDVSSLTGAFATQKSVTDPEGKWSVDLLPTQGDRGPTHIGRPSQFLRSLRPNGLVSIGYDEPGGLMMGMIDDISTERALVGGRATTVLRISGADVGKTLARDHIVRSMLTAEEQAGFFDKIAAALGDENPMLQAFGSLGPKDESGVPRFLGASVQDVVDYILETAPAMRVPLLASIGGVGKVGEFILTRNSVTSWNDGRIWSDNPRTYTGTIWDYIKSILDEDFYECFIDSTPFPRFEIPDIELIIRPKPFDEGALDFLPTAEATGLRWDELRTRVKGRAEHDIPENQILQESLGFTDADVYAFYLVTSQHTLGGNPDGLKEGLFYPAVDLAAVARSGLRSYEGRLSLLAADIVAKQEGTLDYDGEVADEVVEYRNRLFNWYRCNEYFMAGQVTVPGKDEYRCGDPVLLRHATAPRTYDPKLAALGLVDKGLRFYCPQVAHNWSAGGMYTTQMSLMRGHNASVIARAKKEIFLSSPISNPKGIATVSR
jgi:hypothetical protein